MDSKQHVHRQQPEQYNQCATHDQYNHKEHDNKQSQIVQVVYFAT